MIPYSLEQLFVDQDRDWVIETIAPVLAWVLGATSKERKQPFRFEVDHTNGRAIRLARADLAEAHLSLWCRTPRISIMEQLKP